MFFFCVSRPWAHNFSIPIREIWDVVFGHRIELLSLWVAVTAAPALPPVSSSCFGSCLTLLHPWVVQMKRFAGKWSASFHMLTHHSCAQSHSYFSVKAAPSVNGERRLPLMCTLRAADGFPTHLLGFVHCRLVGGACLGEGSTSLAEGSTSAPFPSPLPKSSWFLVNPQPSSSHIDQHCLHVFSRLFWINWFSRLESWRSGIQTGSWGWDWQDDFKQLPLASHLTWVRYIGHQLHGMSGCCTAHYCCEPLNPSNVNCKQNVQGS